MEWNEGRGVIFPPSNWRRGSAILLKWFTNMEPHLLDKLVLGPEIILHKVLNLVNLVNLVNLINLVNLVNLA